jgi:hypothetical protein
VSTLVVLGVVLLAVAGVLYLALDQPDQPATVRPGSGRGNPLPEPAPAAIGVDVAIDVAAAPTMVVVEDRPVLVDLSTPAATRVRSAVTLMMLVAVLGVAVALLVAAVVVGAARVVGGSVA